MKVAADSGYPLPKLKHTKDGQPEQAALHEGRLSVSRPAVDLLEISHEARQLADGAVQHREAYRYDTLPERPHGAPDDYIKVEDVMRRVQPEMYSQLQEALSRDAAEGLALLTKFAKLLPQHPEWLQAYRAETQKDKSE